RFSRDWSSDVCSSDLIEVRGDELDVGAIEALTLQGAFLHHATDAEALAGLDLAFRHLSGRIENVEPFVEGVQEQANRRRRSEQRSEERRVGKERRCSD